MDDFLFEIFQFLSSHTTQWTLTAVFLVAFWFLEQKFPYFKRPGLMGRTIAIILIAVFAYGLLWVFEHMAYQNMVALFLSIQLISIAKLEIPVVAVLLIGIVIIDLVVYTFHFLSHHLSFLWRLHSVHHADEHVDAKTGVLHHPIEVVASLIFLLFFVVILGIPIIALTLYGGLVLFHSLFTHANIALPKRVEQIFRWIIVTPDMHRVHHSVDMKEGNSNFGQVFSVWDRVFGTYTAQPAKTKEHFEIGLAVDEKPEAFSALGLLLHPFIKNRSR